MADATPQERADAVKGLPDVKVIETADEEKFDCPPDWYLVLNAVGMSVMTAITVIGAFFFLLATPNEMTNHCWLWDYHVTQAMCTTATVAFWTYPILCCIFVGLIFTKNMVDARMYYEFLLHKVFVGYERRSVLKIFNYPALPILLVYAVVAMTSTVWHFNSLSHKHESEGGMAEAEKWAKFVPAYLTYLTPVISFVATLITKWSVQYFLIPLCEFLEDFEWGKGHIYDSCCFEFETIHAGYLGLEKQLRQLDEGEVIDTPHLVALVSHYCVEHQKKMQKEEEEEAAAAAADSAAAAQEEGVLEKAKDLANSAANSAKNLLKSAAGAEFSRKKTALFLDSQYKKSNLADHIIYWPIRMFFNKKLKDDRSYSFQLCSIAYLVLIILFTIWGAYIFFCCVITALQLERVLVADEDSLFRANLIKYFSLLHGRGLTESASEDAGAAEAEISRAFAIPARHLKEKIFARLAPGM